MARGAHERHERQAVQMKRSSETSGPSQCMGVGGKGGGGEDRGRNPGRISRREVHGRREKEGKKDSKDREKRIVC